MNTGNSLRVILEENGYKLTTIRQQLYKKIERNNPISARKFIEIAKTEGYDSVTVYRNLNLFKKLHLTDEYGYGRDRILHLRNQREKHYHFIRCQKCNKATEFKNENIELQLTKIAQEEKFSHISSHFLEIIGICKECTENK